MVNNIATSIEQSKILLKLGIDASKASMSYLTNAFEGNENDYRYSIPYKEVCVNAAFYNRKHKLPAWTLVDLIELLPDSITNEDANGNVDKEAFLCVNHEGVVYETISYGYKNFMRRKDETLIDVAVRAIKDLKDKKLI